MFLSQHIGAGPGPDDDFWYMPVGTMTAAGARVTPEQAMRLSTVYKCVRVRAETIGMLPLVTYRRLDNGGKDRAPKHPLAELLHTQPNPWQTAMQWREMKQGHLDLRGNAYSKVVYNGAGRADMLLPLHPDLVKVEVLPNHRPRYEYTPAAGGKPEVLVAGEILHIAGMSADGYVGLNPIELERESIGAAIATRDYGARYFANDAQPPGWIEFGAGKFRDEDAKRSWQRSWQENYGGRHRGKTPVLENGMKYHQLGVKNTDAEFLDSRKYQDVDIAGLFRVPPHKIGILDEAKWGNIEQQSIDFVMDAIMPSCVRWEQALRRDLEFGDGYFAEFLIDMLLRGDTLMRYTAHGKGIQDGWMTRNEARMRENLNPLPGLDQPLQPLNMAPTGSRAASKERGEDQNHREQRLAHAAAQRVVNKEVAAIGKAWERGVQARGLGIEAFERELTEFYASHVSYVADVMCCDEATARAWCDDSRQTVLGALAAEQAERKQVVKPLLEAWLTNRAPELARLAN